MHNIIYSCLLAIPNKERKYFYNYIIIEWFYPNKSSSKYEQFSNDLVPSDIENFTYKLQTLTIGLLSYHYTNKVLEKINNSEYLVEFKQ